MPLTSPRRIIVLAVLIYFGFMPPAHAYIDPTAAGTAVQSLYVLVASALVAVAMVPKKIADAFAWMKARLTGGKPAAPRADEE
jgi:hypothetical protein